MLCGYVVLYYLCVNGFEVLFNCFCCCVQWVGINVGCVVIIVIDCLFHKSGWLCFCGVVM